MQSLAFITYFYEVLFVSMYLYIIAKVSSRTVVRVDNLHLYLILIGSFNIYFLINTKVGYKRYLACRWFSNWARQGGQINEQDGAAGICLKYNLKYNLNEIIKTKCRYWLICAQFEIHSVFRFGFIFEIVTLEQNYSG